MKCGSDRVRYHSSESMELVLPIYLLGYSTQHRYSITSFSDWKSLMSTGAEVFAFSWPSCTSFPNLVYSRTERKSKRWITVVDAPLRSRTFVHVLAPHRSRTEREGAELLSLGPGSAAVLHSPYQQELRKNCKGVLW